MRKYLPKLFLTLMLMVLSTGLWAQQDPLIGTWKQNIGKGKSTNPTPAANPTTSYTIKYEPYGKDGSKVTGDQVTQQRTNHITYACEYDGKDCPLTGDPARDTTAMTRVDRYTTVRTNKKEGKVVDIQVRVVSRDGKSMTTTTMTPDAQGQVTNAGLSFFDKQ
ncbi:MAG: hypothetical protein HY316_00425 [Acidobacteria bacterium]|nr:hypothetical protein [Acidobacteriota bacterium]